jgi:hypothetical protein
MTTQKAVINPQALLNALAQQPRPLPDELQRSLQETGQSLRNHEPEAAHQLRELIRQDPLLEAAYQTALEQWDKQYTSQERTKSFSATLENSSLPDSLFLQDLIPSRDWVTTAQQIRQKIPQPVTERFWDKTDRIAVMTAGGAALGGAVGQIPGAIVGAVIAGSYGWYIGFAKTKSPRKI